MSLDRLLPKCKPAFLTVFLFISLLTGCGDMMDDLSPTGVDKRALDATEPVDFTAVTSLGETVSLSTELLSAKGAVLYFTMWCPYCDSHMTHMRSNIIGAYPDVKFFIVDYVSGSVAGARAAQISSGYSDMTVLADTGHSLSDKFNGTMGTTVVMDKRGVIVFHEDYKPPRLEDALEALL